MNDKRVVIDFYSTPEYERRPIYIAMKNNFPLIVKVLIATGKVRTGYQKGYMEDEKDIPLLVLAAKIGHPEVFRVMLESILFHRPQTIKGLIFTIIKLKIFSY